MMKKIDAGLKWITFTLVVLVSGCNEVNELASGSVQEPAPTTDPSQYCTPAEIAGQWRVKLTVFGVTRDRIVTVEEKDVPGDNRIVYQEDDITLTGTIDPSCVYMAGTASQGSLDGIWKADKL